MADKKTIRMKGNKHQDIVLKLDGVDLEILHAKKREAITKTTLNKLFNIQSPPIIVNDERKRAKETTSERSK